MQRFHARELPATAVGLSLVLAPLFALASAVVAPALKNDQRAQLEVIAQHPSRWYWFTVLLLIGSILLLPALIGIAALVRERAPRLGNLGGGLALLGFLIAIGDVTTLLVEWQMAAKGADRAQMAQLLERFDNNAPGAEAVFAIGGLSALIGTALLTIGLIRGRAAPPWAAIGISTAVVVNIAGFTAANNAIVALSWLLLLIAMGYIAPIVLAGGRQSPAAPDIAPAQTATEIQQQPRDAPPAGAPPVTHPGHPWPGRHRATTRRQ